MQSTGQRGSPLDPYVGSVGNLRQYNNNPSKSTSPHEGNTQWGSPSLAEASSSTRSDGATTTAATSPSGYGNREDDYERSAPPPGFTTGASGELLLWGQSAATAPAPTQPYNGGGVNNTAQQTFLQTGINNLSVRDDFVLGNTTYNRNDFPASQGNAVTVSTGGGLPGSAGNSVNDDRAASSSFSNLAAMIGSGLAQSMEDSTQERPFGNDDALSYQRMARHAANRLVGVGASPPVFSSDLQLQPSVNHQYSGTKQLPHLTPSHFASHQQQEHNLGTQIDVRSHQQLPQSQQPRITTPSRNSYSRIPGSGHSPNIEQQATLASQILGSDMMHTVNAGRPHVENDHTYHRSSSPVQMFPGQSQRRNIPAKDIGMNVIEPDCDTIQFRNASDIVSHRLDNNHIQSSSAHGSNYGPNSNIDYGNNVNNQQDRNTENVWRPEAREFRPSGGTQMQSNLSGPSGNAPASSNSSVSDSQANTEVTARTAEIELRPYLWDPDRKKSSRTIAILRCSYIRTPDVRAACDRYGQLENFRADFSSKGIFFVAYYDIRSAQYASRELQANLQRLSVMQGSSEEVLVQYCIPLNASSQFDESQILISDVPSAIDEYNLKSMLSTYGSLRSVANQGEGYFVIEFQSTQDAKQALLEIDSSQPFGPNVTVEVGLRNPIERKKGRELLAIIGRWRHGLSRPAVGNSDHRQYTSNSGGRQGMNDSSWHTQTTTNDQMQGRLVDQGNQATTGTTQFILGPDGRYTQVFVQSSNGVGNGFQQFPSSNTTSFDPRHQQLIQGPNGQIFIASALPTTQLSHHNSDGSSHVFIPQSSSMHHSVSPVSVSTSVGSRVVQATTPYYTHVVTSGESISISGRSHRSGQSSSDEKDSRHLQLDPDIVEIGNDARTSLMVRNIPNKYTQQMLLNEFEENGHGPGVIDFFYLPIDFKNRCNRGYAFINFVNYKDIVTFHRRYFGKHWRTFNSDKICDITYARIQGKQAMLKRFENSALMEKDEEYKPLVFVSDGPDKGTRLPFPDPSAVLHSNTRAAI